jgi:hypothetical protein
MDINTYIGGYFSRLTCNNISEKNNFIDYDNFKNFINKHYNIKHLEKNNYIKYVKVKRQIIKLKEGDNYINLISKINSIINIMNLHNIFPNIDIKKYLFKINIFFKLIEEKRCALLHTIKTIRNLFDIKGDNIKFKFKIITCINTLMYKYKLYIKNSKELIHYINKFIEIEKKYEIDHKMIELNNIERSFLGKKSEYTANKVITDYINLLNADKKDNKSYYYEKNIDILKLFNISSDHTKKMKGEIDGMIISYDEKDYIIEKIIEVKSSIKATFEDIKKFISLQKYILSLELTDDNNIIYEKYIFTKKSFVNILNKNMADWTIYICINGNDYNIIEKSYLYFSTILKIIDDNFIKDFYIENNENIIMEKYQIINDNRLIIDDMFNEWLCNINLIDNNNSNIYIKN